MKFDNLAESGKIVATLIVVTDPAWPGTVSKLNQSQGAMCVPILGRRVSGQGTFE